MAKKIAEKLSPEEAEKLARRLIADAEQKCFCPKCGAERIATSAEYCFCPNSHGRLHKQPTPAESRLARLKKYPLAVQLNGRQFRIDGRDGLWEYVNGNLGALDKKPKSRRNVIAKTFAGKYWLVREFRPLPKK